MFGDPNAEAIAEFKLDALICENESISSSMTNFRTLRAQLKWDDASSCFHKGLAERSLDEVSLMETPPLPLFA